MYSRVKEAPGLVGKDFVKQDFLLIIDINYLMKKRVGYYRSIPSAAFYIPCSPLQGSPHSKEMSYKSYIALKRLLARKNTYEQINVVQKPSPNQIYESSIPPAVLYRGALQ